MRLSLRIFHRAGLAVLRHGDFGDAAGHIAPAKEVVDFLPTAHNAVTEAPAAVAEAHNLVAAKEIPFQLDIAQIYVLADLHEIPHRIFKFNTVVHPNTRREGLEPADIVKITDMVRQRRRVQRKGRTPDDPHSARCQCQHRKNRNAYFLARLHIVFLFCSGGTQNATCMNSATQHRMTASGT